MNDVVGAIIILILLPFALISGLLALIVLMNPAFWAFIIVLLVIKRVVLS